MRTFLIRGLVVLSLCAIGGVAHAQDAPDPASIDAAKEAARESLRNALIPCTSEGGQRQHCTADTSQGVTLARSTGSAPCLFGKTWGFDETGIWVSDGCGGNFLAAAPLQSIKTKEKAPEHVPNVGFLLYDGAEAQIYARLFTYARYLNTKHTDPTWTDYFGNTHSVQLREDVQLNKFFLPFSGWYMSPKFRYYLYVWSSNANQGDPAQVVGGGNISYAFNRHVTAGFGITSLPSTRSTEGQFPYWLGVDDRLIADEFFRGSYTTGIWLKGELTTELKYMVMIANNLSTLGVGATQIDPGLDTQTMSLQWLPSTGEFGLWGTFGDFDYHKQLATRLGLHATHSRETKQNQPGQTAIENSQLRLTDGSNLFTADLFGPGIQVDRASYNMQSLDGGIKYKGMSVEAEYYWRKLSNFVGTGVPSGLAPINDHGYQIQLSAMAIKDTLQPYVGNSSIYGKYGDAHEYRAGINFYPLRKRGMRANAEYMYMQHCPVGYPAVPYQVGSNGPIFHANLELNF
jgi:hypothetical protein